MPGPALLLVSLRAAVNERLTAAAEDIFALFERTIADFEEDNMREQRPLEQLDPRVLLLGTGLHIQPGLQQEVKEEPKELSIKQEEELLPVSVPESSAACVKTEEETWEQDVCSETEADTEHSSGMDSDEDWRRPLNSAKPKREHTKQIQLRDRLRANQNPGQSSKSQSKTEKSPFVNHRGKSSTKEKIKVKKHQCSFCKGWYYSKGSLQIHMRSHTGGGLYSCPVCEKTFGQDYILKRHMKTHTGEKPYSCPVCNKRFAEKHCVKNHMRIHTGEKPFSCSLCQKKFSQRAHLDKHKKLHTGERPYCCSICNKTFVENCKLKLHMRSHTGEKPFDCSLCNKTFSKASSLRLHMTTHAGDKPYSCPVCEKAFNQKGNLKIHMRTHTNEKPYNCPVCEKRFTVKSNLNVHMKSHHNQKGSSGLT